eukprot:881207-Prorocentrum_lima.AAC.1
MGPDVTDIETAFQTLSEQDFQDTLLRATSRGAVGGASRPDSSADAAGAADAGVAGIIPATTVHPPKGQLYFPEYDE